MDYPCLREHLTTNPLLAGETPGSHGYIHWRQVFWEHLLNRHRAVAEDLTPLRIFEHGARLQGRLDTGPLTQSEHIAVTQLANALAAGDEDWQTTLLERLGLNLDEELGITAFRRTVLVYVFQRGRSPRKELWCQKTRDVVPELTDWGYITGTGDDDLRLTDAGVAAAGVLMPRLRFRDEDQNYIIDAENYGAVIGRVDERTRQQPIVRFLEIERI